MKRYAPSGKYFTDVISKHPVETVIQTVNGRIEGLVHLHPERRLSDEINQEQRFLAVTNARVINGQDVRHARFLAVNKAHIIWVLPVDEEGERHG